MRSLFLGYFHTSSNQRGEVLHLVAKILEFTQDEMKQLLIEGQRKGWLGGWFHKSATPPSLPSVHHSRHLNQVGIQVGVLADASAMLECDQIVSL